MTANGKIFTINQTWLQCIGCGLKRDLLDERKFKCPKCGNLFDVMHDFSFHTKEPSVTSVDDLKSRFL